MGAPNITIAFYEQAAATIARGDKGIMAMILNEPPIMTVETGSQLEKSPSDYMGKDVHIGLDGSVTGTFKYVSDWKKFSSGTPELQKGYYFGIDLGKEYEGKEITVQRVGNERKTTSKDTWWVLRLSDKEKTIYNFTLKDETEPFMTLNFAGATFLPESDKDTSMETLPDPSKVERFKVLDATDIPTGLSDFGKKQVGKALIGYQNAPKKILLAVIHNKSDYADALDSLSADDWDYLVAPTGKTDSENDAIVSWIKTQRTQHHKIYKAVLADATSDSEGIVNVTTGYTDGDGTYYTPEQSCVRVAGIICGTPWDISATYAPLTDAVSCDILEPDELDEAVDAGKFVFMWDGEKAKVCRAVNSFVTTTATKGNSFKKIKLVEIMDLIQHDIRKTAQDSYIGKYANTYDNKCLLISAINSYFDSLVRDNILESGKCEINIDAHREYIKGKGGKFVLNGEELTLEDATEQQIKQANTGSDVFLRAVVSMIDAIEDITLDIYL